MEKLKRRSAFHLLGKSAFAPRRRRGGSAADPRSLVGAFTASQPSFPSLFLAAPTPESTPGKERVAPIPVDPTALKGYPPPRPHPVTRRWIPGQLCCGQEKPFPILSPPSPKYTLCGTWLSTIKDPGTYWGAEKVDWPRHTACGSKSPLVLSAVALIILEHLLLKCKHQAKLQVENRNRTPR